MYKIFIKSTLQKKIIYLLIIYIIFGVFINYLTNYQFFSSLYENGLSVFVNYVFKDNIVFVGKHLQAADKNFYYIYLSFFIFLLGLSLIKSSNKIIYRKKFLLNDKEENLFSKKEIYIKIILACAFSLFLELAIIRIHSSFLHYFSFLKNVSLISCFLGLGIGYSLKKYKVFLSTGFFHFSFYN